METQSATSNVNDVFLSEDTDNYASASTTLTTIVSTNDPSGIPVIDVQTVTISITSSED